MDDRKNWEAIAKQIVSEQDSKKLVELTTQLIQALDQEMNHAVPEIDQTPVTKHCKTTESASAPVD